MTTTLTTIPEAGDIMVTDNMNMHHNTQKNICRDKNKQWVFQGRYSFGSWRISCFFSVNIVGKVQGSIIFRQYYPEGGWGCVIVFVGVIMMILTRGFQLSFGVLVRPAIWKFKPSLISFVSLSCVSLTVTMMISPFVVAFCKVGLEEEP